MNGNDSERTLAFGDAWKIDPSSANSRSNTEASVALLDRHRSLLKTKNFEDLRVLWAYPHCLLANDHTMISHTIEDFREKARAHHEVIAQDGWSTVHQSCQDIIRLDPNLSFATVQSHFVGNGGRKSDPWTEFRLIRLSGQRASFAAAFNIFGDRFALPDSTDQLPCGPAAPTSVSEFIKDYRAGMVDADLQTLARLTEFPHITFWPQHTEFHADVPHYISEISERRALMRKLGIHITDLRKTHQQAVGATLVMVVLAVSVELDGGAPQQDQHQILFLRIREDGIRRVASVNPFNRTLLAKMDLVTLEP